MTITSITPYTSIRPATGETPPTATVNEAISKNQNNERIYQDVFSMISERYKHFCPDTELGFQQRPGVTADIEPISKKDLIAILEHIKSNDDLLINCKENSAKAPFFNKFYLMSNPEQGWNLRLHYFSVRGSGLGEEDSPHYHRWYLGSMILAGGYINIEYQEGPKTDSTSEKDSFLKYKLNSSKSDNNNGVRTAEYISEAEMRITNRTLYAQGDLKHFPIAKPHSVETHAAVMGTTLTLAHTSEAFSDTSTSFVKTKNINAFPQIKIDSNETFISMLDDQIAHLHVLTLSDKLMTLLLSKFEARTPLTAGEEKHLIDCGEPNYVETSLLPALAIYQMEAHNGIQHREFSEDAAALIDIELAEIDSDALERLISSNQNDLFDKQLTIEIHNEELAAHLNERKDTASSRLN